MVKVPPPHDTGDVDYLSVEVAIVVPSTRGDKTIEPEQFEQRIDYVGKWLADNFGGKTSVRGKGGWVSGEGELIQEPVAIVESSMTVDQYMENRDEIAQFIKERRENWKQDIIMYSIDGEAFMYPDQDWMEGDKLPANRIDVMKTSPELTRPSPE